MTQEQEMEFDKFLSDQIDLLKELIDCSERLISDEDSLVGIGYYRGMRTAHQVIKREFLRILEQS